MDIFSFGSRLVGIGFFTFTVAGEQQRNGEQTGDKQVFHDKLAMDLDGLSWVLQR
jgi:hypothetical protein